MWAVMDGGADVVYGKRRKRDGETKRKKVTAKLFYRLLAQMIDFDIPTDAGDFRLMTAVCWRRCSACPKPTVSSAAW